MSIRTAEACTASYLKRFAYPLVNELIHSNEAGRRIDLSRKYEESRKNFNSVNEHIGPLKERLELVRLHRNDNKFTYWMSPEDVNVCNTYEKLRNRCACFSKWPGNGSLTSPWTHISYAVIPKNVNARFLKGSASAQKDPTLGQVLSGGATQFRFYDFDPRWIVETRTLPQPKAPINIDQRLYFLKQKEEKNHSQK